MVSTVADVVASAKLDEGGHPFEDAGAVVFVGEADEEVVEGGVDERGCEVNLFPAVEAGLG